MKEVEEEFNSFLKNNEFEKASVLIKDYLNSKDVNTCCLEGAWCEKLKKKFDEAFRNFIKKIKTNLESKTINNSDLICLEEYKYISPQLLNESTSKQASEIETLAKTLTASLSADLEASVRNKKWRDVVKFLTLNPSEQTRTTLTNEIESNFKMEGLKIKEKIKHLFDHYSVNCDLIALKEEYHEIENLLKELLENAKLLGDQLKVSIEKLHSNLITFLDLNIDALHKSISNNILCHLFCESYCKIQILKVISSKVDYNDLEKQLRDSISAISDVTHLVKLREDCSSISELNQLFIQKQIHIKQSLQKDLNLADTMEKFEVVKSKYEEYKDVINLKGIKEELDRKCEKLQKEKEENKVRLMLQMKSGEFEPDKIQELRNNNPEVWDTYIYELKHKLRLVSSFLESKNFEEVKIHITTINQVNNKIGTHLPKDVSDSIKDTNMQIELCKQKMLDKILKDLFKNKNFLSIQYNPRS